MANVLERQITEDGYRNAVVKLTGILDTSDISETAISLGDLTGNDPAMTFIGARVEMIEWSMTNGIAVILSWNGLNPQQIYPLAGRGRIYGANYGGFVPDVTRLNYDGSIILSTNGFLPGKVQAFTCVLELIKMYSK